MSQVAIFPDVEGVLQAWAAEHMDATVSLHRPDIVPSAGHVQLWRSGGTRTRLVDTALVNLEARHQRDDKALALVSDVVDRMLALAGTTLDGWQITTVDNTGGIASLPDPRFPDEYRYVAMIQLRVRGATR